MPITVRQLGHSFVGGVDGIDLTQPLPAGDIAAIHDGMDRYAVLVFHDQNFTTSSNLPLLKASARSSLQLARASGDRRTTASPQLLPTSPISTRKTDPSHATTDGVCSLTLYEAHKLPRTARVQALAANNKTRFHLPDGPQQAARDSEMSKSITDFSLHSVAWLYGHDATQVGDA